MNQVLYYLIWSILQIVSFLLIGRFLLQACRADFYNPISQAIVRVTDPLLRPIRIVLPGYKNLDFAAFIAAWITQIIFLVAIAAISGIDNPGIVQILGSSLLQVLLLCVKAFWWGILIVIIASFIAPGSYHPALSLLRQITEPLLAPARRLLPPLGGLDFSPILVFLALGVLEIILPQIFASIF